MPISWMDINDEYAGTLKPSMAMNTEPVVAKMCRGRRVACVGRFFILAGVYVDREIRSDSDE